MKENARPVVHVRENRTGWWAVSLDDERPLAQYTSEFQAREAGRVNAVRLAADLVIHQRSGPDVYQQFDESSGALTEPSFDPLSPAGDTI